jgi:hypothetical protein
MMPKQREHLRSRSQGERSLGHDPDLIARYLAGEDVTEQLRTMEQDAERELRGRPRRPKEHESSLLKDLGIQDQRGLRLVPPLEPQQRASKPPTLALIALAIALAMFATSIWIAVR